MEAPYLSTPRFLVRPAGTEDAAWAAAWSSSPFPLSREQAEGRLREANAVPWGQQDPLDLLICRRTDGTVLGAFRLSGLVGRVGTIRLTVATRVTSEEADAIRTDLIPIIVRWMRYELGLMTVGLWLPADDQAGIAAAESEDMTLSVRLREHVARSDDRVDLLRYEILGRPWRVPADDGQAEVGSVAQTQRGEVEG